jgi:hypothetical protein
MTPPNILSYNAANVPVLQLSVGGAQFSEQELYDFATNFILRLSSVITTSSLCLTFMLISRTAIWDLSLNRFRKSWTM